MDVIEVSIRAQMHKVRRNIRPGVVYCDMCGQRAGSQRHHIITRAHTQGNPEAAALANGPLMTALLCQHCHDSIDTRSNRQKLLQKLYVINGHGNAHRGYQAMQEIFDAVAAELHNGILWTLPEPEE